MQVAKNMGGAIFGTSNRSTLSVEGALPSVFRSWRLAVDRWVERFDAWVEGALALGVRRR